MIHLVFLRGVMPSGKNSVPMKQLQELLRDNGYPDARTYLHTGNIIVTTEKEAHELATHIHMLILTQIGPDLGSIIRTPQEVQSLLANNPFQRPGDDLKRVFFSMLSQQPTEEEIRVIQEKLVGTFEQIHVAYKTAYMYIPGNSARSKLTNNLLEKSWKIVATTRNFNTLSKVLAIAKEYETNN
ncbi:DUF1697 domain-containing protein [Enterococcus saccharolyticus]|uniref:DUF1697 domain-containing protein n=1 Tax=Enterococcus saccharolyticus TaxID=41997 RepID=UPI0039DFC4F5